MLVEVGVPIQTNIFTAEEAYFVTPTLPTVLTTVGVAAEEAPDWLSSDKLAEYRDWILLGSEANSLEFVVDPKSGRVDFIGDNGGEFQSSSLAIFVYSLAYFETHRRLDGVVLDFVEPDELAFEANYEMLRHLSLVDPPAFEGVNAPPYAEAEGGELDLDHAWEWIADGFADCLFRDWAWSPDALRYFAERGIDPQTREPRRTKGD